jgi:xanthine dehydrogenase accessory factor
MRELLAELTRALEQDRDCVYCALIETRGSTPQKAGAAMLVFPDGSQAGTLGGGCVEAEVKQRALRVLAAPGPSHPEVLTFNLDDNYGWDDGLICGGRMHILADPLPASRAEPSERRQQALAYYRLFHDCVEQGAGCTEAVVTATPAAALPAGSRFLFDHRGQEAGRLAPTGPPESVWRHLQPLAGRPRPYLAQGVAFLPILPRVTVFLVGGGHVSQAVARLAAEVDFDVWVLDDRQQYANRERFPAARRLLVGDIGRTLEQLVGDGAVTPSTYALIVTRGHHHDEEALYHLVGSQAGYVGMIGSKRKIRLIYQDLAARGIAAEALARVHAPLGLAIGSQTVPEIAVSIVAELIACRNLGTTLPASRWPVQA